MPSPVAYFEITSKNAPELHGFYRELFGWEIRDKPDQGYAEVKTGEGGIEGGIAHLPDDIPAALTVYVRVDDVDATLERAQALGGSMLFGPMQIPDGTTIAMITDPQGINIGIYKR